MQSLEVISVNMWQILISLCNLTILFIVIKKFLYKPVLKMLDERRANIDKQYADAEEARKNAEQNETKWSEKMSDAQDEADSILQNATELARSRGDKIVADAKEKAEGIVNQAHVQAELEYQRVTEDIKNEIVNVSSALAEKILAREINVDDHREMIDSFIKNIGDDHE